MNGRVGIGLREAHIGDILRHRPDVAWFEVLADNYFAHGGIAPYQLEQVRQNYPLALHCVGMSLGSVDPPDYEYLATVKRLAQRYQALWISDHLCFSALGNTQFHDLLPLPYTQEAIEHTALKISRIQDFLGQRILIENVSGYLTYKHSTINEMQFLSAVAELADCNILLDINNLYVNLQNHGHERVGTLKQVPLERVHEIHLGGFQDRGEFLLDAHDHPVADPVWQLFADFIAVKPDTPVLVEWDNDLPPLQTLLDEMHKAQRIISGGYQTNAA